MEHQGPVCMKINDIDLLLNIKILFENEIILYGAGYYGEFLESLLCQAGVCVSYICDSNKRSEKLGNTPVIDLSELKEVVTEKDYVIIIATTSYTDEILNVLSKHKIRCKDIYSLSGVLYGISVHISLESFSPEFRSWFILKKDTYLQERRLEELIRRSAEISINMAFHNTPGFLLFQPGKVGSSTVYYTLKKAGVPVIHFHSFDADIYLEQLECYLKQADQQIRMITLVRDPVARDISMYMQRFTELYLDKNTVDADILQGIYKYLKQSLTQKCSEEFQWFDKIKKITGIDIFQYPFDKENGWGIVRQGKWEILILKVEKLNQNLKILEKFTRTELKRFVKDNIGEQKNYKYLYAAVKEKLGLSADVLDQYYECNERFDHFYTEQEKNLFKRRYLHGRAITGRDSIDTGFGGKDVVL